MHQIIEFLTRYGVSLLMAVVFLEQIGAPLPATPMLLAMGALIGMGTYFFPTVAALSVLAAVAADSIWYSIGRAKGYKVLKGLCRVSLEPDSCVSNTRYWFRRLGAWALVVAKFFPGLNTVSPPMAGLTRMPAWKFLAADGLGSAIWVGTFLGLGAAFHAQLEKVEDAMRRLGGSVGLVIGALLALWIGFKYW